MKHKQLKQDWGFPQLPPGYTKAVVFIGSSGNVKLDFVGEDRTPYSGPLLFSDNPKEPIPKWEWPWVRGFLPKSDDWKKAGFTVGSMRDTCFGRPGEDYMFQDWLNKE